MPAGKRACARRRLPGQPQACFVGAVTAVNWCCYASTSAQIRACSALPVSPPSFSPPPVSLYSESPPACISIKPLAAQSIANAVTAGCRRLGLPQRAPPIQPGSLGARNGCSGPQRGPPIQPGSLGARNGCSGPRAGISRH